MPPRLLLLALCALSAACMTTSSVQRVRLDRLLVQLGVGSRTEVTRIIRQGRVSVSGAATKSPSVKVDWAADDEAARPEIRVDDRALVAAPLLLAFHKPTGVHSVIGDPWGRPDLRTALPAPWSALLAAESLHPVGRLDADTSGLLLFSSCGELTQRLLHPRSAVERQYVAGVAVGRSKEDGAGGAALLARDAEALSERLARGVATTEGTFPARLVALEATAEPTSRDDATAVAAHASLVVTEGKHRMVRRLLANVGLPVVTLHRVRYGAVSLGELREGDACAVTGESRAWARALLPSVRAR